LPQNFLIIILISFVFLHYHEGQIPSITYLCGMELKQVLTREKSAALFAEAKEYFPGGVNSPVRAFKSVSGPPLFIKHGQGCRITDEDDNIYIDFCCF
jgi:hypothetical protein